MASKFVGEIENTIWPNWHNFKFFDLGMSIKLKSEHFQRFSGVFFIVKTKLLCRYDWSRVLLDVIHRAVFCGRNRKYNLV